MEADQNLQILVEFTNAEEHLDLHLYYDAPQGLQAVADSVTINDEEALLHRAEHTGNDR